MTVRVVAFTLLAALAGCSRGKGAPGSDGTERGACYGNGTCNAGLVCLSDRCVRPPGADCDQVAEALTSIELGNYAPKEERKARVDELAATCRTQHMTKDEGACVLAAHGKDDLALCPRPLIMDPAPESQPHGGTTGLPPSCDAYVALLERYTRCPQIPPEAAAAIRQSVAQMKQQWAQLGTGTMPKAVGDACRQGLDAMKQAMLQLGCR